MHNFRFVLKSKTDGILPSFTGQLINEALLKVIKKLDNNNKLYKQFQKKNKYSPYSLSTLHTYKSSMNWTHKGEIIIKEEVAYTFRLGILTHELAEQMEKLISKVEEMILQIGTIDFVVVGIEMHKKTAKEFLQHAKGEQEFLTLEFLTPTYFDIATKDSPLRFPDPRYLFMDLAVLWNAFADNKYRINTSELLTWIDKHVSVNAFELRTRKAYVAKDKLKIGVKGWVRYKLTGKEKYKLRLHALAQFAKFSNVGENRTAGLGCVRYSLERNRM